MAVKCAECGLLAVRRSDVKEFEQVEIDIPEWHKDIVRERIAGYKKNPEQALDFDGTMDDIEQLL